LIGAGGLFDGSRQETAEARESQTRLRGARTREAVTRQVVDAQAEICTLLAQLELLRQGVTASEAGLQLALRRKEFAVGVVLEAVQAQQDAVQAKLDYLSSLTAANKAQYRLRAALGD
jgi:outer membrane protein TolC